MLSEIWEVLEAVLTHLATFGSILFELIGVCILIWTSISSLIKFLKKEEETGLFLGHEFALALEFLMGGEILHTVLAKDWHQIGTVAGILALRTGLSILLHWELKQEEETGKEEHETKK